jgi:PAS domain S-box-containing protein
LRSIRELREESDLPVVVVDHQGLITFVNAPFQRAFGWKAEELVGRTLTTIIPKSLRDAHNLGFSRFLVTDQPTLLGRPLKLGALTADGREIEAEHVIVAERQGDGWAFAATLRPLPAP